MSVGLSVCPVPQPNLRTEKPRKPKICTMEEGQRSRSPGQLMLFETMHAMQVIVIKIGLLVIN